MQHCSNSETSYQGHFSWFKTTRWLFASVLLTLYSMIFDYLVHHRILISFYAETPDVWRTTEEMQYLLSLCFVLPFVVSLVITAAYRKFQRKIADNPIGGPGCPIRKSIGFGIWTGMLIGAVEAKSYLYIPISSHIVVVWFLVETIKGIGTGLVLVTVYQCIKSKAKTV